MRLFRLGLLTLVMTTGMLGLATAVGRWCARLADEYSPHQVDTARTPPSETLIGQSDTTASPNPGQDIAAKQRQRRPLEGDDSKATLASLAGGALPVEPAGPAPGTMKSTGAGGLPADRTDTVVAGEVRQPAGLLASPDHVVTPVVPTSAERPSGGANQALALPIPTVEARGRTVRAEWVATAASAEPSRSNEDLRKLIGDMDAEDASTAAGAQQELIRRGFGPRQFALARRLTSANPEVRRALAGEVASAAGIDNARWLWWLTSDRDAEVRLTAMTLLATTVRGAAARQLEGLARQDVDPQIQRLAEQLSKLGSP